jgi:5'-3' exonuclease
MGVPGFFAWLLRKYKNNNIITPHLKNDVNVETLFIDANCLFHPQCFKVLGKIPNWNNRTILENKMMNRIINYIEYLIKITNPKNVMISVDGVAPVAKMSQQRKRRFRSFNDTRIRDKIKKKHGQVVANTWSNIVITPGTIFMEKLHNKIIKYINTKTKINITYSSYHSPGEGEHKILKYVKDALKKNLTKNNVYVIYGLDADLIFLSISSQKNNIYLLREANYIQSNKKNDKKESFLNIEEEDIVKDVEEDLNFVSIDEMKKLFFDFLKQKAIQNKNKNNNNNNNNNNINILFGENKLNNVMNDFVVMCYFLGNDFLPHIPSIDISVGGLDMLIEAYISTYLIINKNFIELKPQLKFNDNFMNIYLKYISERESYFFSNFLPKNNERIKKMIYRGSDKCEQELWELDNMRCFNVDDVVDIGHGSTEEWKFRYYDHHFKTRYNQEDFIDQICKHYFDGIMWVLHYYFDECPSWNWSYPFIHAPFISDIYNYYKKNNQNNISINQISFDKGGALSPCEQLLAVLPPECSHILPKSYNHLVHDIKSPIIDLYPTNVVLDMISQNKYWKCLPLIPPVEPSRISNATQNLKLTSKEQIRNTEYDMFSN